MDGQLGENVHKIYGFQMWTLGGGSCHILNAQNDAHVHYELIPRLYKDWFKTKTYSIAFQSR